jgi:hypothetical protein
VSTYPFTRARIFSKLNSRLQGAEAHRFEGLRFESFIFRGVLFRFLEGRLGPPEHSCIELITFA